jgi:hypothetical protein
MSGERVIKVEEEYLDYSQLGMMEDAASQPALGQSSDNFPARLHRAFEELENDGFSHIAGTCTSDWPYSTRTLPED